MPGRGHRRSAAWAIAGCAALALVGCDSHSKPTAVPPVSTSPAPSATTTPPTPSAAPSDPASPTAKPIEGESALNSAFPSAAAQIPAAIDTVRRFFEGLNHETDTGDEVPVVATFTEKCNLCGSGVFNIKSLLDGGHKLQGGHVHLLTVNSAVATYDNAISIDVTESQDAAQQLDAKGRVVQTFPSSPPLHVIFELETDDAPPKIWQLTRADQ